MIKKLFSAGLTIALSFIMLATSVLAAGATTKSSSGNGYDFEMTIENYIESLIFLGLGVLSVHGTIINQKADNIYTIEKSNPLGIELSPIEYTYFQNINDIRVSDDTIKLELSKGFSLPILALTETDTIFTAPFLVLTPEDAEYYLEHKVIYGISNSMLNITGLEEIISNPFVGDSKPSSSAKSSQAQDTAAASNSSAISVIINGAARKSILSKIIPYQNKSCIKK